VAELNEIALENLKAGNPKSEWGLNSGASANIEGFSTDISADIGERVDFKINTDAANYRIDIYRIGSYGGDGARKVATIEHNAGEAIDQPDPLFNAATRMFDAGNWQVTDSWDVPDDAVSGVYIAKLVREDGIAGENHIPFVIRDDDGGSDVVFQTSDTTWQAYNMWGGASLYESVAGGFLERGYAVSYNRPIQTQGINTFFDAEFSAIQFLEANGFDVSYISGVDTARSGGELLEHNLFLSVGHDEYWSGEQRDNVEAARDAGVNLAFWSGNEVYWKTRWETSIDDSGTPYRTLVCYKESYPPSNIPDCGCIASGHFDPGSGGWDATAALAALRGWSDATIGEAGNPPGDPSDEWTGWFRDDPTAPGGSDAENALTGTYFQANAWREDSISVSDAFSDLRIWANTRVADLNPGETTELAPGTLGFEWDINPDNGFRPAGLIKLSSTTLYVDTLITDRTNPYQEPGWATHNLTLYRAQSGALVFGAGSIYWSWALDSNNSHADPAVQQAMINLLADMGIQPATLQSGLVHATQSTDHEAPTTIFTGWNFTGPRVALVGSEIVISGHSEDLGGGIVAGVEVSAGGGIWQYASGSGDWSFSWTPTESGSIQVLARTVDDSLNLGDVTELTVNVYEGIIKGTPLRDVIVSETFSFAKGSAAAKGIVKVRHSTNDDDAIFGKGGKDVIHGLAGDDRIIGGRAGDKILGGLGQDVLSGGKGGDVFRFNAAAESTVAAPDLITDFRSGHDKISLRGLDIVDGQFIGEAAFSGIAGQLRFDIAQHLLQGDLDGDGIADFAVKLGTGHITTHDLLF
jgi:hypothetical protein